MKIIRILGFLFLWFYTTLVNAQQAAPFERCQFVNTSPYVYEFEDRFQRRKVISERASDEVYRIPIVVHIIHLGEPLGIGPNIPEEQVLRQIEILNEDFRRKKGTLGYNENPVGADTKIEFELAQFDPDGNPTSGILRIDKNSVEQKPMTGKGYHDSFIPFGFWNPDHYINIWLFPALPQTILGNARSPVSELAGLPKADDEDILSDGIWINTDVFGETTLDWFSSYGRTLTHEMGHYLGLLHTWGSDINKNCENDDFCADTPPVANGTNGCPTKIPMACDGSLAMIENYMDVSADICMNTFTKDQLYRMRIVLENSPRRKTLVGSPGLNRQITGVSTEGVNTKAIKVYPNPVTERVHISFNGDRLLRNVQLTCHNALGKVIFSNYYPQITDEELVLELSQYHEQVLFLRLKGENINFSQKLILK